MYEFVSKKEVQSARNEAERGDLTLTHTCLVAQDKYKNGQSILRFKFPNLN